jgi:hypothetical protein
MQPPEVYYGSSNVHPLSLRQCERTNYGAHLQGPRDPSCGGQTVCFLHPLDFNQQAKKRTDMPIKFQKIHEEWVCFDQDIGRFKNDIKEGRTCTFNVLIWLGSDKEPKKLIDSHLEWHR